MARKLISSEKVEFEERISRCSDEPVGMRFDRRFVSEIAKPAISISGFANSV
jgi:hypothetical protein